jgi:hypothetical protein
MIIDFVLQPSQAAAAAAIADDEGGDDHDHNQQKDFPIHWRPSMRCPVT